MRSVIFLVVLVFGGSFDNRVSMVNDFHPSACAFVDCLVSLGEVADSLDAPVEFDVTGCVLMSVCEVSQMTWL